MIHRLRNFDLLNFFMVDRIWPHLRARIDVLRNLFTPVDLEVRACRQFKDSHNGHRCFIVGNGASLRLVDMTRLAQETVFTVNRFHYHQHRWGIHPFCHVLIDPDYFNYVAAPKYEVVKHLVSLPLKTHLFFPVQYLGVLESLFGAPLPPRIHFLAQYATFETNPNLDISRPIPGFQTVTLSAITVALYMGFSKIYLVGCDLDFLSDVASVSPLMLRERHFYDEAQGLIVREHNYDYLGYCQAVCRMLQGYQFFRERVRPPQKIVNAGAGGMLDMFERVEFASLFKGQASLDSGITSTTGKTSPRWQPTEHGT